ncbi:heme ABC transporter permease [Marinomonas sp. THO17]|uniref:heme ABC transporter permease n=1 Tax=Marinomonas sp. THO17 TaxID=3149048 RepID=UPI00336BC37B
MNWVWLHKLGSPKWFYQSFKRWPTPLFVIASVLLITALIWGLAFAPEDYQQGNSFRIIYLHVPAAILAQSCYLALGLAGLIFLVWKIKMAPLFMRAVAPLGALMAFVALASGAIWGKPTWGTWWVWDARLTSVLILLFLYFGIMAIQNALEDRSVADKTAAVIGLLGLLNLPIIKYSVVWWNTLHQGASFKLTEKPSMPVEMWLPLLLSVIAFYLLTAALVLWRIETQIMQTEARSEWLKTEVLKDGI